MSDFGVKYDFSLIIPTNGRISLVQNLIDSLVNWPEYFFELIVVYDNSGVESIKNRIISNNVLIELFSFRHLGSSEARNLGLKYANCEYIIFLDDDVKLPFGFFKKADELFKLKKFDCFGGMYYPWYPEPKPKWLPASFGTKSKLRETVGAIDVRKDGFLSGGILAVKKHVALEVGGFSTSLGMRNKGIGYGEEDDFQLRIQDAGYKIGFVPDWWLYHAVLPHKYRLSWHFSSAFARGRDGERIHNKWSRIFSIYALVKGVGGVVYRCFKYLTLFVSSSDKYYVQTYALDVFTPFFTVLGRAYSALTRNIRH